LEKLKENGIPVEAAYLFGSYAKGRAREWSDIDIAVISSNLSDDRFEERIRLSKISSRIDSRRDTYFNLNVDTNCLIE
jgi:predicted nucleotidyltransferase